MRQRRYPTPWFQESPGVWAREFAPGMKQTVSNAFDPYRRPRDDEHLVPGYEPMPTLKPSAVEIAIFVLLVAFVAFVVWVFP